MRRFAPILLSAVAVSCSQPRIDPRPNGLQQVVLAFVMDRAGFKQPFILETPATLPEDFGRYTQGSWLDSGVVQVKEALRNLAVRRPNAARWEPELIRVVGAQPAPKRPTFNQIIGPAGQTIIGVSSLGFSSDSTVAVVYWEYNCGSWCGGADVALFRRDSAGVWHAWRSQMLWIS